MILIGENIHIISKRVKNALENYDENFIKNLVKIQRHCDAIDLNIGPAKGKLDKIYEWLVPFVGLKNISFDTTNIDAIKLGLSLVQNPQNCFINSTSADDEKLDILTDIALEYNCNLIALSMSAKTGIPKSADERMELVIKIYEKCIEKGIAPEKLFFDPLIIPVKFDSSQVFEALNTISMINESFEKQVNSIIGLSNVSNGALKNLRPLLNRVYFVLAFGAGLTSAIIDANDGELFRIAQMLECNNPQNEVDKLYINLANMIQCYGELNDIEYNKDDVVQCKIIKATEVLLNKRIYTDSFAKI